MAKLLGYSAPALKRHNASRTPLCAAFRDFSPKIVEQFRPILTSSN
ncbi:hypothetical protein LGN24_10350 [Burkholderia seminalis]|nr:hypothetical protein [Burkholderia seminalis]MCA8301882.1 hypothetical protein [Burkholderia seminalis]